MCCCNPSCRFVNIFFWLCRAIGIRGDWCVSYFGLHLIALHRCTGGGLLPLRPTKRSYLCSHEIVPTQCFSPRGWCRGEKVISIQWISFDTILTYSEPTVMAVCTPTRPLLGDAGRQCHVRLQRFVPHHPLVVGPDWRWYEAYICLLYAWMDTSSFLSQDCAPSLFSPGVVSNTNSPQLLHWPDGCVYLFAGQTPSQSSSSLSVLWWVFVAQAVNAAAAPFTQAAPSLISQNWYH